jgi:hypothetical protein
MAVVDDVAILRALATAIETTAPSGLGFQHQ